MINKYAGDYTINIERSSLFYAIFYILLNIIFLQRTMFAMQAEYLINSRSFVRSVWLKKMHYVYKAASCIKDMNNFKTRIWNVLTYIIFPNLP